MQMHSATGVPKHRPTYLLGCALLQLFKHPCVSAQVQSIKRELKVRTWYILPLLNILHTPRADHLRKKAVHHIAHVHLDHLDKADHSLLALVVEDIDLAQAVHHTRTAGLGSHCSDHSHPATSGLEAVHLAVVVGTSDSTVTVGSTGCGQASRWRRQMPQVRCCHAGCSLIRGLDGWIVGCNLTTGRVGCTSSVQSCFPEDCTLELGRSSLRLVNQNWNSRNSDPGITTSAIDLTLHGQERRRTSLPCFPPNMLATPPISDPAIPWFWLLPLDCPPW